MAVEVASEILWEATGRQFGTCPVTIRPCRRSCWDGYGSRLSWWDGGSTGYPYPVLHDGQWYNIGCGCPGDCSCNTTSEILLPDTLNEIIDIVIDGVSLPASGYVVYDSYRLVKVDGEWPLCQDWHVTGGPGAWSITASYGSPVTELGKLAVGVLAEQISLACLGQDCMLPERAVSVTTQGVAISMLDLDSFLEAGLTGLTIPDMFIRRYNPANITDRAHVIPLDTSRARVQRSP